MGTLTIQKSATDGVRIVTVEISLAVMDPLRARILQGDLDRPLHLGAVAMNRDLDVEDVDPVAARVRVRREAVSDLPHWLSRHTLASWRIVPNEESR